MMATLCNMWMMILIRNDDDDDDDGEMTVGYLQSWFTGTVRLCADVVDKYQHDEETDNREGYVRCH